jgi:hypothetical protein
VSVASAARLAACALLLLAGCRPPKTQSTGCSQDSECGTPVAGYRCETQTGQCYCRTNEGCPSGQYCNTLGFCQDKAGCEKNADCLAANQFCDTTTGSCLDKGRCSVDLHCALGKVCDTAKGTCIDGCHTSGDCPGSSCRCGARSCVCSGTTQAELSKCAVGVCDPNFCSDKSFCQFGELCGVPPDAGAGTLAQCYSDFDPVRRPYCSNCSGGAGLETCGQGANFCLTDTYHPGNFYCGADCSGGEQCPRGYTCNDIIVFYSRLQCTSNAQCPPDPSLPCTSDTDCKRGGTCIKATGQTTGACGGHCRVREGAATGFCTCQVDSDCPQEACSGGECSISRRKCVTDNDCRTVHCVDFSGAGGCHIGNNCVPGNGLSCLEVR